MRDLAFLLGAATIARAHRALPLECHALVDHEDWRRDVADQLARRLDLEPLRGSYVAGDAPVDDHRIARDLCLHVRAVADGQRITRRNLAFDLALDSHGSFEDELAGDTRPSA